MTEGALQLVPDMLERTAQDALRSALSSLYEGDHLKRFWAGEKLPIHEVELVVLPLNRVGAPEGASGAGVFITYFKHKETGESRKRPSDPLVVKIDKHQKLKDEEECAASWPDLTDSQGENFALPLQLFGEPADEKAVLVALFKSDTKVEEDSDRNEIQVRDLWHLLEDKEEIKPGKKTDWEDISRIIGDALEAVEAAHRCGYATPQKADLTYSVEYAWYLRKTLEAEAEHIPALLFGCGATTPAFGREWPNPAATVKKVLEHRNSFSGRVGAVHGDLHPKNIVLTTKNQVRIIDFGWANGRRHIMVDYLLLDLNLRSVTLPSQVTEEAILAFASFLEPSQNLSPLPAPLADRARIIQDVIWKRAGAAIVGDWTSDYLIPLFLVGFGLLVHLDKARNQPALVATVLRLSELIDKTFEERDR